MTLTGGVDVICIVAVFVKNSDNRILVSQYKLDCWVAETSPEAQVQAARCKVQLCFSVANLVCNVFLRAKLQPLIAPSLLSFGVISYGILHCSKLVVQSMARIFRYKVIATLWCPALQWHNT